MLYYLIHNLVECIITWTIVMWKLLDPVIKILFREVLRETSILWMKDVV